MSYNADRVQAWRKRTKQRLVDAMGSKCNRCQYNDCIECFDFHHVDPSSKEIGISKMLVSPSKWNSILDEISKCVLLCCRCHRELHAGLWSLDEIELNPFREEPMPIIVVEKIPGVCQQCGAQILGKRPERRKYCSRDCVNKSKITLC